MRKVVIWLCPFVLSLLISINGFAATANIELNSGWNLISLYVQPEDPSIVPVLSSIQGKYISVWTYVDGVWLVYDPENPGFSDLTTMEAGMGYWVNMKQAATLMVSGNAISHSVDLSSGWNLVGYSSDTAQPIDVALASIQGEYMSVWAYMDGVWYVYDPENPGFSDLLLMEPDYGYWISAKSTYTIQSLAAELGKNASTDAEKSWAIWVWITDNIAYDVDAFFSGIIGDTSASQTLENRKSVCDGYANLFYALAGAMNLEAVKISGYAKGYGYVEGQVFESANHAWNAVKIDGIWKPLDATWGAGYVSSDKEFVKSYNESYYMPDPEHFIFTHLPQVQEWQLLDSPITKARFEELPQLKPEFFSWGFTPQDVYDVVDSGTYRGIVKQYPFIQYRHEVEIIDAPVNLYLDAGTEYTFIVRIPDSFAVSFYNSADGTWYWCHEADDPDDLPPYGNASNYQGVDSGTKTSDGTYTFNITPAAGNLLLGDMYLSDGTSQFLLEYIVE
jgi:hypothetical protein